MPPPDKPDNPWFKKPERPSLFAAHETPEAQVLADLRRTEAQLHTAAARKERQGTKKEE